MSGLTEALRRGLRGPAGEGLPGRLAGLDQAVEAGRDRVPDGDLDHAARVVTRAGERLRLSPDHTVVALAGATGSGKSSLFNALCDLDLAAVGVRRPTTSWALACAWGPDGASEILDWIGIPARHQVNRSSTLDQQAADRDLEGLILLDLPDHDSTEVSHHLEVDRLVELVDMIVWVVDPQKYADHALHDRYLRRLADHGDIMMVALNHADTLADAARDETLADIRRLLADDGLPDVAVTATSATTGLGMDKLRDQLRRLLGRKEAAGRRIDADVRSSADRLGAHVTQAPIPDVRAEARGELSDACADAAGVGVVVDAIEQATRVRGRRATGWPVTAWLARAKPDPLKRLHLGASSRGDDAPVSLSSLPEATPVQKARVETAIRSVSDQVSRDLPEAWSTSVRRASTRQAGDVTDQLDVAVASADLGVAKDPAWWSATRAVQLLLLGAAVVGGLWLLALGVFGYLRLPEPGTVDVGPIPLPTFMLLGGLALGLVVAALARWANARAARSRARRAGSRLRAGIDEVTDRLVVEPVAAELEAYQAFRQGVAEARGR